MSGLSNRDAGHVRLREVHSGPSSESDAELVAALKQSEAGAAGRVYDRYARYVHAIAYRLLGATGELDDVVQEVFIYAFFSIDKLRDPAALKSWLGGITTGQVRAHLRRRWRNRWLNFFSQEELAELPGETPEPQADMLRELYVVLDRLAPDERIAVVLRRIEGLPIHEAAKLSGMSLSTFKRRYARGEARLLAGARGRPVLANWLNRSKP